MKTSQSDLEFLSGGGQAGRLIAQTDWTTHAMGPAAGWTPACRTALSMVLNSGFPSYVLWGPEHLVFYNDAYMPILGNKAALGQGVPLAELWSEIREEAGEMARVAFGGEASFFKDRPFMLERFGYPQQGYFTFSFSPIRDADGIVVGVLCTVVETTTTVVGMRKLKDSEDRLQLSLDASGNIGTWTWYPDTNSTYVDERFARLFQVDAALAQSGTQLERFTNMIHPDDRERVMAAIGRSVTTGALYDIDYRIPQLSGLTVWVKAKGQVFIDAETQLKRFAGVAVDITEDRKKQQALQRMAEESEAMHRRQSEFLATLAHELRNPLAPIRTGLELMRLGAANPQTVDRLRGMMERQVNQLTHLINDLMDISRINNGKVELQTELVDIGAAIVAAAETSLPHIERARHHLATHLPDQPLLVDADPTRLAQILSNILTNAAKYTPPGGAIAIKAWREDDDAVIAVTDNGVGIAATELSAVFDMFSQVGNDAAQAQGGLGIGLSLVKRLVELHGGVVGAASAGKGQGATFTVRLPLAARAPQPITVGTAEAPGAVARSGAYTIVVADDNVDAAETLAAILRFSGHTVHVAADGEQAVQLTVGLRPDVAFLDIGMPSLDGHQAARQIRRAATLNDTVLVALTGWATPADRNLSRDAGFDHHLAKPVSIADIEKILIALPAGRV